MILHDSTIVKKYIDFNVETYKLLWTFEHKWDQVDDEKRIISALTNNTELLKFHDDKNLWLGCFGCMTVITYDYIKMLDEKYTLGNLVGVITNRYNRCSFERVLACMLMANKTLYNFTLFGDIHTYYVNVKRDPGYSYAKYVKDNYQLNLPIVKLWAWRDQSVELGDYVIKYGVNDNNVNITNFVLEKCVKENIAYIPKNDRDALFGDPLVGVHKSIFINDKLNNITVVDEHHSVYIDLNLNKIYIDNPPEYIKKLHQSAVERLADIHKQLTIDFGSFKDEFPEQVMVATYLTGSEKVLEIGGNIGRNSLVIAHILNSNGNTAFVSLECDPTIAKQLEHNRDINKLTFQIESSALSKRKLIQKG